MKRLVFGGCLALSSLVFMIFTVDQRWYMSERNDPHALYVNTVNDVTNESLLIYKAYYETREFPPRIRILANSQCRDDGPRLLVNGEYLNTTVQAAEGSCPWAWAVACKWNAFIIESDPFLTGPPNEIAVLEGHRSVVVPVERVPSEYPSGLTVCVPPLYWMSDWARLIVFFEIWKRQGATRFILWKHSISDTVRVVLDHYVDEGILDLRNWPYMPLSDDVDPNLSTYRLTHSLAHMDCSFRAATKFATLNDIDEFLVPSSHSKTLLKFLEEQNYENSSAYAFEFFHTELQFIPPFIQRHRASAPINLRGLLNTVAINHKGPPKVAFLPQHTSRLTTHQASGFFNGSTLNVMRIPPSQAAMLHARNSFHFDKSSARSDIRQFNILRSGQPKEELKKIEAKFREIYNNSVPLYSETTNKEIARCLSSWRTTNCKTPIHSCASQLMSLQKWEFSHPTEDSRYYVL